MSSACTPISATLICSRSSYRMRSEGLLMADEFSRLSPETRSAIKLLPGAE